MHRLPDLTACDHAIYEDRFCYAVLAVEPYTIGHTLVILNKHKRDIVDDISTVYLSKFMNAIQKVSRRLMESAENEHQGRPDNVYVCILCDGVKHFHAHLLPRYPFTKRDKATYRRRFSKRDGKEEVNRKIAKEDLGGFWYVAEREITWKESEFGKKTSAERAKFLEELARKLRVS